MKAQPIKTAASICLLLSMGLFVVGPLAARAADTAQPAASASQNGSDHAAPGSQAAAGNAAPVNAAQAAALGTAVGSFWQVAWAKAWPLLRDSFLKVWPALKAGFGAIGTVFKEIGGSVNANVNSNANAPAAPDALNAMLNEASR